MSPGPTATSATAPGSNTSPRAAGRSIAARAAAASCRTGGPYDVTTLNDLLSPVRVDVVDAWLANPVTALDLPPGTVFDVEEHGGASLRYHLPDGAVVAVTYELSACTHGEARSITEVEGLRGAARWDWLMLEGRGDVIRSRDKDGAVETATTTQVAEDGLGAMDKPLYYFHRRVHGLESRAVVDEQAVFNFSCLRAIYDCAASGQPRSVAREAR